MKTQQELMQAYWGPGGTVDMVKEYNAKHGCDVKPWECVKTPCVMYENHPGFIIKGDNEYTFALTILYDDKRKEHRPVFVGDTLYFDECGDSKYTVEENGYSVHGEYIHGYDWRRNDLSSWSWNPPTPKRTFKLNDVELPCPLKTEPCADNLNYATLCNDGQEFYFESTEYKMQWRKAFTKLLTAARDKE